VVPLGTIRAAAPFCGRTSVYVPKRLTLGLGPPSGVSTGCLSGFCALWDCVSRVCGGGGGCAGGGVPLGAGPCCPGPDVGSCLSGVNIIIIISSSSSSPIAVPSAPLCTSKTAGLSHVYSSIVRRQKSRPSSQRVFVLYRVALLGIYNIRHDDDNKFTPTKHLTPPPHHSSSRPAAAHTETETPLLHQKKRVGPVDGPPQLTDLTHSWATQARPRRRAWARGRDSPKARGRWF